MTDILRLSESNLDWGKREVKHREERERGGGGSERAAFQPITKGRRESSTTDCASLSESVCLFCVFCSPVHTHGISSISEQPDTLIALCCAASTTAWSRAPAPCSLTRSEEGAEEKGAGLALLALMNPSLGHREREQSGERAEQRKRRQRRQWAKRSGRENSNINNGLLVLALCLSRNLFLSLPLT